MPCTEGAMEVLAEELDKLTFKELIQRRKYHEQLLEQHEEQARLQSWTLSMIQDRGFS